MEIKFVNISTEHSITHELFFISGNITLNDIINKANEFNVPCKINIEYECENDNIRKLNESFIYNHIRINSFNFLFNFIHKCCNVLMFHNFPRISRGGNICSLW